MITPAKKLKSEPSSQERGMTPNSREQTTPVRTPPRERDQTDGPKIETPTLSGGKKSPAIAAEHRSEADEYAHLMEMLGTADLDFAKGNLRPADECKFERGRYV